MLSVSELLERLKIRKFMFDYVRVRSDPNRVVRCVKCGREIMLGEVYISRSGRATCVHCLARLSPHLIPKYTVLVAVKYTVADAEKFLQICEQELKRVGREHSLKHVEEARTLLALIKVAKQG